MVMDEVWQRWPSTGVGNCTLQHATSGGVKSPNAYDQAEFHEDALYFRHAVCFRVTGDSTETRGNEVDEDLIVRL